MERRPDVIINIGDQADLSTLASYDRGMKAAWGKFYKDDVAATLDAQARTFAPIQKYNNTRSKNKKVQYNPLTIHTLGNHCAGRYDSFLAKHPEFTGHISLSDLQYEKYWNKVVPYLTPYEHSGITYSHYFFSKSQRYPIGTAKLLLQANHRPCIAGHSHSFDYALTFDINGRKLQAAIIGCYIDKESNGDMFNYTGGHGSVKWWNGLTYLHDVNEFGEFDLEQVSIDRVRRDYG